MKEKKPLAKRSKRAAVAPAVQPKPQPRELTRAEKTAAAREAAAKRNAARVTPSTAKAPQNKSNGKPAARRNLNSRSQVKKEQQINSRQEISRKISTQTPTRRQDAKTKKKVSGSVKNIEIKNHKKSANHSFRVKKKQRVGRLLLGRLVLFLVVFVIMFACVAGLFSMSLRSDRKRLGKEYTLQLGADIPKDADKNTAKAEEPSYVEIPGNCATRFGNLYIPVSAFSDMCKLTVTGTQSDLRYLPRESEGHSMRFVVDSDIAYINGAKVRMISPSFIHEGKLYIPLDFLQKYSEGLTIETDDGNRKITVAKILNGYDAETDSNLYSTLTFNLSATSPLTPVEEPIE